MNGQILNGILLQYIIYISLLIMNTKLLNIINPEFSLSV